MNKVFLSGYISRNPDSGNSARSGTAFSRASLAVNSQSSRGQFVQYIDIVAFGELAHFVEKAVHQGDFVIIEGQLSRSRYTNRAGQNAYRTNVVVDSFIVPKSGEHLANQVGERAEAMNDVGYPVDAVFPPNTGVISPQNVANKVENDIHESVSHSEPESEKESSPFKTTTYRVDHPQDSAEEKHDKPKVAWEKDIA